MPLFRRPLISPTKPPCDLLMTLTAQATSLRCIVLEHGLELEDILIAAAGMLCTRCGPRARQHCVSDCLRLQCSDVCQFLHRPSFLASCQWMTMRWAGQMVNLIEMLYPKPMGLGWPLRC